MLLPFKKKKELQSDKTNPKRSTTTMHSSTSSAKQRFSPGHHGGVLGGSLKQRLGIAVLICVSVFVLLILLVQKVIDVDIPLLDLGNRSPPPLNKNQDLFVAADAIRDKQQEKGAHQDHAPAENKNKIRRVAANRGQQKLGHIVHDDHDEQHAALKAGHEHEAFNNEKKPQADAAVAEQNKDKKCDDASIFGAFKNNNPDSPRAVLVRAVHTPETDPVLKELNAPYHELRRRIRDRSCTHGAPAFHVHTFFTMDCTDHSAWQAGTLENSWEKVGQEGVLTRVISGCEAWVKPGVEAKLREKVERTKRHFLRSEQTAKERRGSFYAPYSSTLPSGRHYAPYNRPHSVYYWLKHADLTEEVFVMLDPDMVFLNTLPTQSVRLGAPASQVYEYMENTAFEDMHCPSCPNKKWDRAPYAVGPPWMMHLSDWIRVTPRWMAITGELAERYPQNWIAEMIAFSVACKVENLPHATTYRAMVDNVDDAIVWQEHSDELGLDGGAEPKAEGAAHVGVNKKNPRLVYPSTLHYCYTLELGEMPPPEQQKHEQHTRFSSADEKEDHPVLGWYHFSKYRVPTDWPGGRASYGKNFMECDVPLLQEFRSFGYLMKSVFGDTESPMSGGQQVYDKKQVPARFRSIWRRADTMLDLLIPAINDAMTTYKNRYCTNEATRNLKKLLRTTHPGFFISRWELGEDTSGGKGLNVSYKLVAP